MKIFKKGQTINLLYVMIGVIIVLAVLGFLIMHFSGGIKVALERLF